MSPLLTPASAQTYRTPSSIAQQRRKCRDRADENGHVIPLELEFADEAVSGTKRDREGLNAMLAATRAGRFGTLYFESLSRLAPCYKRAAKAIAAGETTWAALEPGGQALP